MKLTHKDLMLASKMKGVPADYSDRLWTAQPKWDGHRRLVRATDDGITLIGRNGIVDTQGYKPMPDLPCSTLDGEYMPSEDMYVVFDLLEWEGVDLRQVQLEKRMTMLSQVSGKLTVDYGDTVRIAVSPYGEPSVMEAVVRKFDLEGLVVKRRDSKYMGGRSTSWQKWVPTSTARWSFSVSRSDPGVLSASFYRVRVPDDVFQVALSLPRAEPGTSHTAIFRYSGWKATRHKVSPRYVQFVEFAGLTESWIYPARPRTREAL